MSAESEAVKAALDKLAGTATYGGAVGPSGLTSLLGTNPAQLAAKETASGAAESGLGNLLNLNPGLGLFSTLVNLMGIFDDKGFGPAVETTPEQDALQNIETKVAQVAQAGQSEGGTEGAMESLEDAMAQGLALGIAPGDIIAPVVNARIPGITDIPIIGDILDGMANATDKVLNRVGLPDIRADVTIGTDGTIGATFEPKKQGQQRQRQTGAIATQGQSSSPNGSTATVYSGEGDEFEDILIGGGTGGDVIDAKVGENTTETLHLLLSLLCKDDETYDRATMSCLPIFGTGTKKAEKVTCPEGYERAGEEVDSYNDCGDKTSTVTVGAL